MRWPTIGVLDASAHVKQGKYTPGVQRQWCGETGKRDNCVIGQHLLYTDNDLVNPFSSRYPYSWQQKAYVCEYYQQRNEASCASRRKIAKADRILIVLSY